MDQGTECWNIRKFKITKTKYIDWKETDDEDDKASFKKPTDFKSKPPLTKIISRLGTNDVIVVPKSETKETASEEVSGPPVLVPKDQSKKKTNTGSGGNSDVKQTAISAKVTIPRDPGDESEYTNRGSDPGDESDYGKKTTEVILNKAEIVSAEKGVIDLDALIPSLLTSSNTWLPSRPMFTIRPKNSRYR